MTIINQGPKPSKIQQGMTLIPVIKHITQKDINQYAEASGDFNPIHVDETFAASTPLGGTIAHGMLVLAYLTEMVTCNFGSAWYSGGRLSTRFKAPARPQDIITISGKVDSIVPKEDGTYANCSIEVRNQREEAIITGEVVIRS